MAQIDKTLAASFMADAIRALDEVAAKYGLARAAKFGVRYDDATLTVKTAYAIIGQNGEKPESMKSRKEAMNLDFQALMANLDTTKVIQFGHRSVKLVGHRGGRASRSPWVIQDVETNEKLVCTDQTAKSLFRKS